MVPRQLVDEWLKKADEDFEFASHNLSETSNNFYSQICFHFQQAAEKYLKAYIVANKLMFKKIHELSDLLNICKTHDPSLNVLEEDCNFLTDFYIDTRYPVHWPSEVTREEALDALKSAQKIRDLIKKKL